MSLVEEIVQSFGVRQQCVPGPTADSQGRPQNTLDTVADAMLQLEKISLEDNLRLAFDLLDTRRDGTISVDALQEVLKVRWPPCTCTPCLSSRMHSRQLRMRDFDGALGARCVGAQDLKHDD